MQIMWKQLPNTQAIVGGNYAIVPVEFNHEISVNVVVNICRNPMNMLQYFRKKAQISRIYSLAERYMFKFSIYHKHLYYIIIQC